MELNKEEKKFLKRILYLEKLKLNSDHESFTVSILEDFPKFESQQIHDLIRNLKLKGILDYTSNNLSTYTLHISDEMRNFLNKK